MGVARRAIARAIVTAVAGVAFVLAPLPATAASAVVSAASTDVCTVSSATLTWGFKESFRAYLSSTIAKGEWVAADGATYTTPDFAWSGGGALEPATRSGQLDFVGSVRFTGHGDILDTTIAQPRIVLDGASGSLLLDVSGTTQDGVPVDAAGVDFAVLDVEAAELAREGGTLTWAGIPAVLTEAGSDAFGTYAPGEVLDPLTVTVELDDACASAVEEAFGDRGAPAWTWWLLGAAGVAVAVLVGVLLRRRRAA